MYYNFPQNNLLKLAVVTGNHPHDVPGFQSIFRAIDDIDFYVQDIYDLIRYPKESLCEYDCILFYNFNQGEPCHRTIKTIDTIIENKIGVILLHHAILAYEGSDLWNSLVGIENRKFEYYPEQNLTLNIVNKSHPICHNISDWQIIDETYKMDEPNADSDIIITTENIMSMKSIAWTRTIHGTKIFCFASGHNNNAYSDESFRKIISNAIFWCAGGHL
ncbi:MAG: ThuA domain-containing protein [Armatimonadota bacterium]